MKRFLFGLAGVCGFLCLVSTIVAASFYFSSSEREQDLRGRLARLDQAAAAYANSSPAGAAPSSAPLNGSLLGSSATGMGQSDSVLQNVQGTLKTQLADASHKRRLTAFCFLIVSAGLAAIALYVFYTARRQPKMLSDRLPAFSQGGSATGH